MNNSPIYGAICGDIIGSVYEGDSVKTTEFPLFMPKSRFTDDTVMTCAVVSWFNRRASLPAIPQNGPQRSTLGLIRTMQRYGRGYEHRGYGGKFSQWIYSSNPRPYNSFGNGSAMRVSSTAIVGKSLQEVLDLAGLTAAVSHNHPEGIKGAQAVAAAIYLTKEGKSKKEIKSYLEETFGYNLHRTIDEIRPSYKFDVTCQGSVPEAIICWLESDTYEETIRKAISLGGDADTQAAIAGSIAAATHGMEIPDEILNKCKTKLDEDLIHLIEVFHKNYN